MRLKQREAKIVFYYAYVFWINHGKFYAQNNMTLIIHIWWLSLIISVTNFIKPNGTFKEKKLLKITLIIREINPIILIYYFKFTGIPKISDFGAFKEFIRLLILRLQGNTVINEMKVSWTTSYFCPLMPAARCTGTV